MAGTGIKRSRKKDDLMGVMTRKSGEEFVITSDRIAGELPSITAPKKRGSDVYQVWTGDGWSESLADAKTFTAFDAADEYTRENFDRVMGPLSKR